MDVKCSVFIGTSLDGFIARKNGEIDWLTDDGQADGSEDYGYKEFFASVDTMVMGRNTYELALTFPEWPYTGKKVMILSSGSPTIPKKLAEDVTVTSGPLPELIQRLLEKGARHVYVDGGKTIQGFLAAGLIHEMTITRLPILIGDGIPLFGPLNHDVKLEHLQTKTYENGFVQTKYRIKG
jgi:dihydrofolate reductase